MEIPIANISKPPKDSRLLRGVDKSFVAKLKDSMLKHPSAPGAATVAVLCNDVNSVDQFELKHKDVYK